ncbi:MAG: cytochrome c oxidase subunit II [Elusimicrobiota bacterium]
MIGHYGWGLPIEASSYARSIDGGLLVIHAAMLVIFVLWGIFFAYLLVRYRKKEGVAARRDEGHGLGSLIPDLVVVIFEIVLILFYAIPVWSRIKVDIPPSKDVNTVDIVAQQFAWNVRYPGPDGKFGRTDPKLISFSNPIGLDRTDSAAKDDIIAANEIHLPVGKPTRFNLTSLDVIHDFAIAEFRVKQDIVPGMRIPIWVTPTKIGTYELSCAQLCGFGHSLMRADVIVQSPADYQAWLKSQEAALSAVSGGSAQARNPANSF